MEPGDDDNGPQHFGDDPRPLGEALDRVVRGLGAPSTEALIEVFGHWSAVAGERLAGHCRPLALRDGVLVVAVTDPLWATELRYRQGELLERLAERLGGEPVTRVDVRIEPPP